MSDWGLKLQETLNSMKVLQLGQAGQLARELIVRAARDGVELKSLSRDDVDLSRPEIVESILLSEADFDVLVISAAYTAVDKAEEEEGLAHIVNGDSVAAAARACARRKIPVIHISTDYVFDGQNPSPYTPDHPVSPVSAYGRSKLAGEKALAEIQPKHVIIRTAWVYSPYGKNFVKTMLRVGAQHPELRVVDDQRGCPTAAGDLADAILSVAQRCVVDPTPMCWGVFHYGGKGVVSWCEFARAIFEISQPKLQLLPSVVPISTSEYPTPAKRPENSSLECSKILDVYGIETKSWREALGETLAELARRESGELT